MSSFLRLLPSIPCVWSETPNICRCSQLCRVGWSRTVLHPTQHIHTCCTCILFVQDRDQAGKDMGQCKLPENPLLFLPFIFHSAKLRAKWWVSDPPQTLVKMKEENVRAGAPVQLISHYWSWHKSCCNRFWWRYKVKGFCKAKDGKQKGRDNFSDGKNWEEKEFWHTTQNKILCFQVFISIAPTRREL